MDIPYFKNLVLLGPEPGHGPPSALGFQVVWSTRCPSPVHQPTLCRRRTQKVLALQNEGSEVSKVKKTYMYLGYRTDCICWYKQVCNGTYWLLLTGHFGLVFIRPSQWSITAVVIDLKKCGKITIMGCSPPQDQGRLSPTHIHLWGHKRWQLSVFDTHLWIIIQVVHPTYHLISFSIGKESFYVCFGKNFNSFGPQATWQLFVFSGDHIWGLPALEYPGLAKVLKFAGWTKFLLCSPFFLLDFLNLWMVAFYGQKL